MVQLSGRGCVLIRIITLNVHYLRYKLRHMAMDNVREMLGPSSDPVGSSPGPTHQQSASGGIKVVCVY